jgi:molybdate transport system ATP-binding protein
MERNGEILQHGRSRLAAVLFDRYDDVDAAIAGFVASARQAGARVAGFVQERIEVGTCECEDFRLRDLETGDELAIMQDLGRESSGCRVDPAAVAVAAERLGRALADAPDLLIVNRFGKLESEGGGVSAELGEAVALGLPVVVAVPIRFRGAWDAFAGGLDTPLPPQAAALEAWWSRIASLAR